MNAHTSYTLYFTIWNYELFRSINDFHFLSIHFFLKNTYLTVYFYFFFSALIKILLDVYHQIVHNTSCLVCSIKCIVSHRLSVRRQHYMYVHNYHIHIYYVVWVFFLKTKTIIKMLNYSFCYTDRVTGWIMVSTVVVAVLRYTNR